MDHLSDEIDYEMSMLLILASQNSEILDNYYEYPDEDFCLFHHFPHNKLVYPLIDPGRKVNCSCTIIWLTKSTLLFYHSLDPKMDYQPYTGSNLKYEQFNYLSLAYCSFIFNYEEQYKKCNFKKRIELCQSLGDSSQNVTNNQNAFQFNNDFDLLNLIKLIEYVLLVILNPIIAFFGIISNIMVVYVIYMMKYSKSILHKEKKRPKEAMFDYIMMHSIFNVIFCIIMILKIINECLFITPSLFCSAFLTTKSSQYFKIIFIEFFGNVIKMCCNMSYTAITLSRLILMQNKKDGCFKYINKVKVKHYLIGIIVLSSIISSFKLFQPSQPQINIVLTGSIGGTNDATNIYVPSGSSISDSIDKLVLAINNSSSIAPYATSIGDMSASINSPSLRVHAKTQGIIGNSYSLISGSTTFNFAGAINRTNDSTNIFILSGSNSITSTAAIVEAINNSSSVAPYNSLIGDISASNTTSTLNLYAKTVGTVGNSYSTTSGSTITYFTGGVNGAPSNSNVAVLYLDRPIPNSPSVNINHFVVRRKVKDVNNGITLNVNVPSSDDSGFLFPEFPTDKIKENLPTIIASLQQKGLI
jgi:hypothetical protein